VSQWKVILATLIIFACGVITGGLLVKNTQPQKVLPRLQKGNAPTPWVAQRFEFHKRIEKELDLKPEQKAAIEVIFKNSQDRMKPFWDKISPQLHEEVSRVQNEIRAQLSPEQEQKFDELLKAKPKKQEKAVEDKKRHQKRDTNTLPSLSGATNQ
jgi:Spy/CpxP family protein refolding chaperone